jgi:hypothetical protein
LKLVAADIPGAARLEASSVAATAQDPPASTAGSRAQDGVRHKVCIILVLWLLRHPGQSQPVVVFVLASVYAQQRDVACLTPFATCSAYRCGAQPEHSRATAATTRMHNEA